MKYDWTGSHLRLNMPHYRGRIPKKTHLTYHFVLFLPPSDRLPRGEEQRAEPRRESQVVRHRREGPGREAGAAAAHQEVFPDVPTAVTTGKQGPTVYWIKADSTWKDACSLSLYFPRNLCS